MKTVNDLTRDYASTTFDEIFDSDGNSRGSAANFVDKLSGFKLTDLRNYQAAADLAFQNMGITFNVYGHGDGAEKIWPFDVVPRIIGGDEWHTIDAGLRQRIQALNLFIDDIYNDQHILNDQVVPRDLLESANTIRPQLMGFSPPEKVWCHISGVDLVRDSEGKLYVLEDNLRCPSGVSYVIENREIMKRTFPGVFEGMSVVSVEEYPEKLLQTLLQTAPQEKVSPTAVLLTPGIYNSAYFEHTFLASQMGIELVQGSDLVIQDRFVFMRTTQGLRPVDVIYRRIDDDFLDPLCFREDSCLGVPGLMDAYRAGNVTLANAPGTGVADDKAVYAYVPKIIQYYLKQDPILDNVPTYVCSDPQQLEHVINNLDQLVVKPTNESGGYGILMGPQASQEERDEYKSLLRDNPRNYIAQPMLNLSTVPTLIGDRLSPRHVDLRPFVLCGRDTYVMPGGLTRVALKEGSLVVNSSQGGGSKDTWVLGSVQQQQQQ